MKNWIIIPIVFLVLVGCSPEPLSWRQLPAESFGFATLGAYQDADQSLAFDERPLIFIFSNTHAFGPVTQALMDYYPSKFFDEGPAKFFEDISFGNFIWTRSASYGPFDLSLQDETAESLSQRIRPMIEAAIDSDPNFIRFDRNGDGVIRNGELGVAIVDENPNEGGAVRMAPCFTYKGINICLGAAFLSRGTTHATMSHELMHLLGTIDVYGSGCLSMGLSTMSCGVFNPIWLDPWHMMRLGWLKPIIKGIEGYEYEEISPLITPITQPLNVPSDFMAPRTWDRVVINNETPKNEIPAGQGGCELITDPQKDGAPLLLYTSARRNLEFFMIEARARGLKYNFSGHGVHVWVVRTDENNNTYSIPSLRSEYMMDMSIFSLGPQGERGDTVALKAQDGVMPLRWIDGKKSGLQIRVSDAILDEQQFSSSYWVEWGSADEFPTPTVYSYSHRNNQLTILGELGLGKNWSIRQGNEIINLTPTSQFCNRAIFPVTFNPTGWSLFQGENQIFSF